MQHDVALSQIQDHKLLMAYQRPDKVTGSFPWPCCLQVKPLLERVELEYIVIQESILIRAKQK